MFLPNPYLLVIKNRLNAPPAIRFEITLGWCRDHKIAQLSSVSDDCAP